MNNIQWEQHKDGNYYAYRNGHELIGFVDDIGYTVLSKFLAASKITDEAKTFAEGNLNNAKQWVVDQANGVL